MTSNTVGGTSGPADDAQVAAIYAEAATLAPAPLSRLISMLAEQLAAALAADVATAERVADAFARPPSADLAAPEAGLDGGATTGAAHPALAAPGAAATVANAIGAGEVYEAIDRGVAVIVSNGIDPSQGQPRYRLDLAGARRVAAANRWGRKAPERLLHTAVSRRGEGHLGLIHDFSYDELPASKMGAGWGLVIAAGEDTAVLEALAPLITKRCEDQGIAPPPLTFNMGETCGAWLRRVVGDAYVDRPMLAPSPTPIFLYDPERDTTVYQWCARHGVRVDAVDPRRGLPYYLLLVGRPGPRWAGDPYIPFDFQYDLDFYWGVGRIGFTDGIGEHRLAAYTAYAERLVAAERGQALRRDRSIAYVATRHEMDQSTNYSSDELVLPLLNGFDGRVPLATRLKFAPHGLVEGRATRDAILGLLSGEGGRPGVLFSATHGIDLPFGHPDLIAQQGALVCQDWSGYGPAERRHWLAGADLPAGLDLTGLIGVCFACFSTGCPSHDQFRLSREEPPKAIAPYPFLAQLPQQLLERGALAVLGHVDRAWSYSFREGGLPAQTQAFEDLLGRIMAGKRLGEATDQFNTRQGQVAVRLTMLLDNYSFAPADAPFGLQEIGPRWAEFQDARAYSLLGDPAARLMVDAPEAGAE